MQISVIINPRSGRGDARNRARTLQDELRRRGHRVEAELMSVDHDRLRQVIADSDRVVVSGGDGTVHHLLPTLSRTRTPLYHLGSGTANLIAHEFGMSKNIKAVVDQLEGEHDPILVDLPVCNGYPFLIMVSLGIDASVIHRLEESRSAKGGYRAYIAPVMRELLSPRPAKLEIRRADGTAERRTLKGILVIANLRSYGGGFNPCADAQSDDGLLDAALLPCSTSIGAVMSYGLMRLGWSPMSGSKMRAASFELSAAGEAAYVQIDGERATMIPGLDKGRLVHERTLKVSMSDQRITVHAVGRGS